MDDKFKNKFRIASARLKDWDYRWAGAYFITICTKNRTHFFGDIVDDKMILSNVGILANVFWHEIKNHTKNVELGEFVVMPNHIHGILILGNDFDVKSDDTQSIVVETLHATSLQQQRVSDDSTKNDLMADISPKSNSISTIIRSYKSAVTKHANRLELAFGWQTRFHDHIIRDEQSFNTITQYIRNNPANWEKDKFY